MISSRKQSRPRPRSRAGAGRPRSRGVVPRFRLFEVAGLELEYAVVDAELRPRTLVGDAFRALAGRATSDVELDGVGFSNELAAHVFEMKTLEPARDLAQAERDLVAGLRRFAAVLDAEFGARLLPTGMHPFMRPTDTTLWPGAGRRIYETYARVFDIHEHGWLNVQSMQVNLPFGSEIETVALHNATACLLPYLPALTASSPFVEGEPGPCVDNRLGFYRQNQRRVPEVAGRVVPEYMSSYAQYRRDVLGRIYAALDAVEGGERLQHEWVNSRGAILRFDRTAIEVRTLDLQECIKMDVAVAVFVRAALKALVRRLDEGRMRLPDHDVLVADFDAVVRDGGRARVRAPHLVPFTNLHCAANAPQRVLERLLEDAAAETPAAERPYLKLVEQRLRAGNLSERILGEVARGGRGSEARRDAIRRVYGELADCLQRNEAWMP
jgi:carboxylate-amine ligase